MLKIKNVFYTSKLEQLFGLNIKKILSSEKYFTKEHFRRTQYKEQWYTSPTCISTFRVNTNTDFNCS